LVRRKAYLKDAFVFDLGFALYNVTHEVQKLFLGWEEDSAFAYLVQLLRLGLLAGTLRKRVFRWSTSASLLWSFWLLLKVFGIGTSFSNFLDAFDLTGLVAAAEVSGAIGMV
jgi:hypothetical protein